MKNFINSKLFKIIFISIVVIIVGFLSYKTFYRSATKNSTDKVSEPSQQIEKPSTDNNIKSEKSSSGQNSAAVTSQVILPGFKLYKNSEFGFEIQYPDSWTVSEENIENVRGENTSGFFFKKPDSDLRFAILPRDGLSYGLPNDGTTTSAMIGGSSGSQTQFTLPDGRRLWLIHPKYGLHNWSEDIGRIDILSSIGDPAGDTIIFEKMLGSFKLKN